jgi:hypothetical protein
VCSGQNSDVRVVTIANSKRGASLAVSPRAKSQVPASSRVVALRGVY